MSLLEDPDIAKIATLKIAKEIDHVSREIQDERSRKKAELASRGLTISGAMISTMQNFNLRVLESRVRAVYTGWKEALVETGYELTPDLLENIRDKATEALENAPSRLAASLREQCRGMDDIVDKISGQIDNEVYAVRARFLRDAEIEIAKSKVALRSKTNTESPRAVTAAHDPNLLADADAKKMVLEIISTYLREGKPTPKHPIRRRYAEKRHILDALERQRIIQTLDEAYLPTYGAFDFENAQAKEHADHCVSLVIHALQELYGAEGARDYSFTRISETIQQSSPNVKPEEIQLGAILATSFRSCVGNWGSSGNTGVASMRPLDRSRVPTTDH